ncbi:hypothetical protein [Microbacterium album]|uniref:LysR substrate-binding domain-containing protein n=1 Tax=Microbacterium album TaxID=2053191 RepID=A0A917IHI5_9MICO|nr:hypothetical protein [Microbacterium album]GGH47203.1 hypothetical protein GCM10010921_23780 [Microbacterium album]
MTVPGFLSVPFLVAESDMYAFVPSRVADVYRSDLDFVVAATPVQHPTLVEAVYWHPSKNDDPALRWIVKLLRTTAERIEFASEAGDVAVCQSTDR